MFEGILQAFTIPEVRKRIFFTLGAFAVFRFGIWIPVPGVDPQRVQEFFQSALGAGGVLGLLNLFTGGAFEMFSMFALGVIPYINASIIMSLLQSVIPYLKELNKQGEEGRKIINRYVRYGTVGLAILQAAGTSYVIAGQGLLLAGISPYIFYFTSVVALTTGTMFLMWLGERITENGIGRGVSMIIMAGIIAGYPDYINRTYTLISSGAAPPVTVLLLLVMFVVVVAGVVLVQLGARRMEIQYAKRMVRGRVYGGQNTYIPFGVNQGGVIPIIFAAAILTLPQTLLAVPSISSWIANGPDWLNALSTDIKNGGWLYLIFYGALIIFFTYFYSAIVFNPQDLADNLRRWGGFIPGIRPGKSTSDHVERIQTRLLTIGGLFLASIALMPYIVSNLTGLQAAFALGGTSILIVVGVGVDTVKQIEAHMVERHYESLIRKGAVLGRKI